MDANLFRSYRFLAHFSSFYECISGAWHNELLVACGRFFVFWMFLLCRVNMERCGKPGGFFVVVVVVVVALDTSEGGKVGNQSRNGDLGIFLSGSWEFFMVDGEK
jgi:hypothetical protein